MKVLFISDTHGFHNDFLAKDLENIDIIIFAGDESNSKIPYINENESRNFFEWFDSLKIQYKICIAGNHSTAVESKLINPRSYKNIIYLEHESTTIEDINIFGSPYTPEFHNWAFNVRRDRLHEYWKVIPTNTDILITHGPPKGILDLGYDRNKKCIEYCGDNALLKRVMEIQPKYHIFGHIHDNNGNSNKGIRTIPGIKTTFINASCVTDGKFDIGLTSKGIKLEF